MRTRGLIAAVVMTVVAVACGGGALSVDEYFERLDERAFAYDQATDALADRYEQELDEELSALQASADLSTPEGVDAFFAQATQLAIVRTATLFTDTQAELRSFLDDLRALEPPEAVRAAHEEALAAGELALAQLPAVIDEVRGIESIEALAEVIASSAFVDAQARFGESCRTLETVASDNGIEVDLDCPSPETVSP